MNNIAPKQRGVFLVLFVIALASLMAIVLFGNALSSVGKRADDAARNQESFAAINAALIQFIQLNLRVPCPASGFATTGLEDTTSPTNTVTCLSPSGVVPWKTLGLSQAAAQDSWGRMISYRVYDGATGFTRANGLNLSDCLDSDVSGVPYPLSAPGGLSCNATTHENTRSDFFATKGLSVNDRGALKTQVAYALISHGASGYGAYAPSNPPTRLTMPEPTSKEFSNANAGGTYWILDPSAADISAEDANHFDDIVSYAVASDLVMAAKAGGRAWPLAMALDRTDSNWPSGSTVILSSPQNIVFSGGPIKMSAFNASGARYIASVQHGTTPSYYSLGAKSLFGGSGDLSNSEGLGFDFNWFRVKRRVLKVGLVGLSSPAQAQFIFYDGGTQLGSPLTKLVCTSGAANITIDAGNDFNKVEIQAPYPSSFSVASIAACHDTTCTLPTQLGQGVAVNCP